MQNRSDPTPKVETLLQVTEAMMDAGAKAIWVSGITDGQVGADRLVAADIFRAMYRAFLAQQKNLIAPG